MRANVQVAEEHLSAALESCYMAERDPGRSSAFLLQAYRLISSAHNELVMALERVGLSPPRTG
jgi:hypothetical protein